MNAEQHSQLSARHAVFVPTAMHTQQSGNDYERRRRDRA
jgi:hypothetical protein